jgi:hypothetical protein
MDAVVGQQLPEELDKTASTTPAAESRELELMVDNMTVS